MASYTVKNYRVGPIQTNCYFMINEDTKQGVIVDPGDEPQKLSQQIRSLGFSPAAILLTHAHFDHVMGVPQLKEETGAPVYLHEAERLTLEETETEMFPQMGMRGSKMPVDFWMEGEPVLQIAGFMIRVSLTPGHTRGGVCYYFENEKVLFSGDTLFCGSIGRTDFPGGSYSALIRSVEEKLFILPDEIKVYPGHDESTSIGFEKKYNPFF